MRTHSAKKLKKCQVEKLLARIIEDAPLTYVLLNPIQSRLEKIKYEGKTFTFKKLEKEWRQQKYPDSTELLKIFPEAEECLEYRLKILQRAFKQLKSQIKRQLQGIYDKYSGFDKWFFEKLVEIFSGNLLDRLSLEIINLKFLLPRKYEEIVLNGVSKAEILKAKMFPMPILLGLPVKEKIMTKSPFRSEKSSSFWITQNSDRTWFSYDFGCQKGWDNIQLLMDRDNLKFVEAVKKLQ